MYSRARPSYFVPRTLDIYRKRTGQAGLERARVAKDSWILLEVEYRKREETRAVHLETRTGRQFLGSTQCALRFCRVLGGRDWYRRGLG